MKAVLVQNKIASAISTPDKYPESWTGEILAEKLGDAQSCLIMHLKDNILREVEVTSEPSHEHTLKPELALETNEESNVLEPNEPILDNSDDDENHPEAQAQALRDYQLPRDRGSAFLGSSKWQTYHRCGRVQVARPFVGNFQPIKKTTQTSIGAPSLQPVEDDDEVDDSYHPSDDEEDETTFEQLWINQEIQWIQLTKLVESTCRYADELAYQRASIDRQEVILARLCKRFRPDQGNSRGGDIDFGP
ncbi:hypothetical protein M9H77_02286 [Catharanthus roseus]|uniref:Uncharacterized protein n=1 Tax=Catharanthus roseus TaxID=4058 RepID=A0ACC0C8E1_CATRO|nr:hypothetical protein M9H77_02286 [Catharanthus roseus]